MFLDIIKQILGVRNKVISDQNSHVTNIQGRIYHKDMEALPHNRITYMFPYQICIATEGDYKGDEVIKLEIRVRDIESLYKIKTEIKEICNSCGGNGCCEGLCQR